MRRDSKHSTSGIAQVDWRQYFSEHERWLRSIVGARLRDGHATDDVMQEVAVAALRGNTAIRDPEKVGPWLYRVAIRQVLMYRRGAGRRRAMTNRYAERQADRAPSTGDALSWLLSEERRQMVRAGLRQLPERDAQLLLLKYTENWSYREIAEKLGISQSAVEARLHRARGRLRRELSDQVVVAR